MFYAKQSPRGFSNEIDVYAFSKKSSRDQWVARHNQASACTARDARQIVGYKGDAITKSFNSDIIDGDQQLAFELDREQN